MNLDPSEHELLLRIYTAERRWANGGHEQRNFLLLHTGGMHRVLDHPGWEEGWPVPTSQAIDDLDEYGFLRVEPSDGLNRNFVLSVAGRRAARALEETSIAPPGAPQSAGAGAPGHVPTAFVSWAHDSPAWQQGVLSLVLALRASGVDADVDLFHLHDVDIEWSTYGARAIEAADFVLIVVSAPWKQRFHGTQAPSTGVGAAAEADAILGLFDQSSQAAFRSKIKVLLLPGANEDDIPLQLRGSVQRFTISAPTASGLEDLLRVIHRQPAFPIPNLGPVPVLPAKFVADATDPTKRSHTHEESAEPSPPTIHGATAALLRHLREHGPRTARELELALGDIDQIGPAEICEWTAWATAVRITAEARRDGQPVWEITAAGRQLIG